MVVLIIFGCICFIMYESSMSIFYFGAMNTIGDIDILIRSNADVPSLGVLNATSASGQDEKVEDTSSGQFIDYSVVNVYGKDQD